MPHFLISRAFGILDAISGVLVLRLAEAALPRLWRRFRGRQAPPPPGVIEVPFIESRTKVFAPKLVA